MVFLMGTNLAAMVLGMENLSISCVASLMTILSAYLWAETKRPSKPKSDELI